MLSHIHMSLVKRLYKCISVINSISYMLWYLLGLYNDINRDWQPGFILSLKFLDNHWLVLSSALEMTLLNRLTPNLKHFVIILHLDYFVPTIFCTLFCTEIREWYTKHIDELKYWENNSSSWRQKMWCLHITIGNNFIKVQIVHF